MSNLKIEELMTSKEELFNEYKEIKDADWPKEKDERVEELKNELQALDDKIQKEQDFEIMNRVRPSMESESETAAKLLSEKNGKSVDENTQVDLDAKQVFANWLRGRETTDFQNYLDAQNLSVGTDSQGGHTVGEQLRGQVIDRRVAPGSLLAQVTRETVPSGEDISWPTGDNVTATATLVGENANVAENTSITFGTRKVTFDKYATGYVKVSEELLTDSRINIVDYVQQKFSEIFTRTIEAAIINGHTGSSMTGIISDVPSTLTTDLGGSSNSTPGDVIQMVYDTDPAYEDGAVFIMNRRQLGRYRRATNTGGDFILQPSLQVGSPATINAVPLVQHPNMQEEVASSPAARKNIVLYGNPRAYTFMDVAGSMSFGIVPHGDAQIAGQTWFLSKYRYTGKLLDVNAFRLLRSRSF